MKTLTLFIALFTASLHAQTIVTDTEDFISAKLTQADSEFLNNALMVDSEIGPTSYTKRISTMDGIAQVECERSSLLTSKATSCVLKISKNPVREQSTVFHSSDDYFIALVENYHEGERLYSSYNFYEMRSKNGRARFFYSDDMRVLVNCIHSIRYESFKCQFGIR